MAQDEDVVRIVLTRVNEMRTPPVPSKRTRCQTCNAWCWVSLVTLDVIQDYEATESICVPCLKDFEAQGNEINPLIPDAIRNEYFSLFRSPGSN